MNPITLILIILLVVVLFGGGYGFRTGWYGSPNYGYGIGIVGVLLIVLLVLLLTGRLG
jgi:hypothetical protein